MNNETRWRIRLVCYGVMIFALMQFVLAGLNGQGEWLTYLGAFGMALTGHAAGADAVKQDIRMRESK